MKRKATVKRRYTRIHKLVLANALLSASFLSHAQEQLPPKSPEILADHRVTFRYLDPGANKVSLHLAGAATPASLTKGPGGLWTITTAPLAAQIYDYEFDVDGREVTDPSNPKVTHNLLGGSSVFTIPGDPAEPWELRDVPHGVVHHHLYTSTHAQGLAKSQSEYYVYTPPGYDAKASTQYPVLFLLHGWSDSAAGWTAVGSGEQIFDNLIAAGKIKPMIVVMPLGYGDMHFVQNGFEVWKDAAAVHRNTDLFSHVLFEEIMPMIEAQYPVRRDRAGRAIAGLSMGGLESLSIGLNHSDLFAWIGGFSSAVWTFDSNKEISASTLRSAHPSLLWIACGTDDDLLKPNRELIAQLKSAHLTPVQIETPGAHEWIVWRQNLIAFTQLLFNEK